MLGSGSGAVLYVNTAVADATKEAATELDDHTKRPHAGAVTLSAYQEDQDDIRETLQYIRGRIDMIHEKVHDLRPR